METKTGARGSPHGVDDRHAGDLRIILCDRKVSKISGPTPGPRVSNSAQNTKRQ